MPHTPEIIADDNIDLDAARRKIARLREEYNALAAEYGREVRRLNFLCDRCYFPREEPLNGFSLAAGCDVMPPGTVTLNFEKDRKVIREAIDRALPR